MTEALNRSLADAEGSRIVPPHPAATSRAYLWMRRWHLGRGRLSGHYVVPLLIGSILLFVLFTVEELCIQQACIPIEGTQLGTLLFRIFWNAYILLLLFCLQGAILRLASRIRLRRRARRLDPGPSRSTPEPKDEGPEARHLEGILLEARSKILDPRQHEPQLRQTVHAYGGLAVAAGLLSLVNFQACARFFAEEGYLGGKAAFPLLLGLVLGGLAFRCVATARTLHRGARELYEEAEALIERHQAALERLRRGEAAEPLAVSFRRYGANPIPGAKS